MIFNEVYLNEIVDVLGDGLHGTPKYSEDGEYYFINGNNLQDGKIVIKEATKRLSTNEAKKYMKPLSDRTLFVSINGTLGRIAKYNNEDVVLGKSACFFNVKENVDRDFIYYVLLNKEFQNYIERNATGTTIKNVSLKTMRNFLVSMPDYFEQKRISKILGMLDAKINLNNQTIDTLEEMASTLFKRWFVDFEFPDENGNPYKSSGGKMIDSELGEIPDEWRVGKLSDYGQIVGGGTPSKKKQEYYDNGAISWITPKDLSELKLTFIEKGKLSITDEGLKKSSAKLVPKGTVLFSSRAPIGYMAIAKNSLTTNQGFKSIVPNKRISSFFIYLWLKQNLEMITNLGTGSTFKEVSGGTMKNIDTVIPKSKKVSQFDEIIVPVFKLIEKCESENSNLINTRDTLLPKLLSGELEV